MRKEFLYANSLHHLNERIEQKLANGWYVIGEVKEQLNGKFGCLMAKEMNF